MLRQDISHLKGEVCFREKLARQHVDGENVLPDYYQKDEKCQIRLH